MRITAKIATAGVAGMSRFPLVVDATACCDEEGRFDEAKARRALAGVGLIQFSSDDDRRVLAFALEYLKQQRAVVRHLAEATEAKPEAERTGKEAHDEATTVADRRCERNLARGRVCYVRTDVTARAHDIRIRIDVQNPRGQVGWTEGFARDYAILCARCVNWIVDSMAKKYPGFHGFALEAGPGCPRVFEQAREMERLSDAREAAQKLNAMRESCAARRGAYCGKPFAEGRGCPCYRNGRCEERSLDETENTKGTNQ